MTAVLVEPLAGAADLDGVLAVEQASFTNPWTRDMYLAEFASPSVCHVYVARTPEHAVAGFCAFWIVVDEMHINNVAVLPALRGGGIGTALIGASFTAAEARGARRAMLEVRASNTGARRLYERLGFRVEATRRAYYSSPVEDALVLWREGLRDRPA